MGQVESRRYVIWREQTTPFSPHTLFFQHAVRHQIFFFFRHSLPPKKHNTPVPSFPLSNVKCDKYPQVVWSSFFFAPSTFCNMVLGWLICAVNMCCVCVCVRCESVCVRVCVCLVYIGVCQPKSRPATPICWVSLEQTKKKESSKGENLARAAIKSLRLFVPGSYARHFQVSNQIRQKYQTR